VGEGAEALLIIHLIGCLCRGIQTRRACPIRADAAWVCSE
jgi:hypothetical protein